MSSKWIDIGIVIWTSTIETISLRLILIPDLSHQVSNRRKNKNRHRSTRGRKEPESDPSDSQHSDEPRETQPVVTSENGVGASRIPEDISEEVRQDLIRSSLPIQHLRVRFDDTPVFIELERKVDDYDII